MTDGYLQPKVDYTIDDARADRRRVTFQVEAGPHYDKVVLAFDGASGIDPDELDTIVEQQELERQLFTDPLVVTELLERYYRDQGYLSAEIDEPRIEYQGAMARVVLAGSRGSQVHRASRRDLGEQGLEHRGAPAAAAGVRRRAVPADAQPSKSLDKIRTLYWPLGYNDVRSDYSLVLDRAAGVGRCDVHDQLKDRRASSATFRSAACSASTSSSSASSSSCQPGEPLDLSALAKSRRNLYDTGAFSSVRIDQGDGGRRDENRHADDADGTVGGPQSERSAGRRPQASPAQPAPSNDPTQPPNGQKPVPLNVVVREVQPLQMRYGASYDTERGVGGILDVSQHNWLGGARVIGLQARVRQAAEGRPHLHQSAGAGRRCRSQTTGSVYFREDLSPPTEITRAFNASRKGASIQQEVKLLDSYVWSWGYRYEHARTLEPVGTAC